MNQPQNNPARPLRWVFLCIIALIGVSIFYTAWKMRDPSGNGVAIGKPAPDLSFTDLNGRAIHLSDFRGKVIVLNYFTTWCPPCQQEAPELARFAKSAGSEAILIMVDRAESPQVVRRFLDQYGIETSVVIDSNNRASRAFGVNGQPETFLIDQQGTVRQHITGPTTYDRLRSQVDALLRR